MRAEYRSDRRLKKQISLAETLERVLNKGAVLVGEVTISVADIDLIYLGINLLVSSVETVEKHKRGTERLHEVA